MDISEPINSKFEDKIKRLQVNLTIISITSITGATTIASAYILYNQIKEYRAKHLKMVSLGILFLGLLPISFIPMGILEGDKYTEFISVVGIIGGCCTIAGMTLITWNLKIHQKVNIPRRFMVMLVVLGNVMSQIISGTTFEWVDDEWIITRTVLARLMIFLGTAWILFELFRVFIIGIIVSPNRWSWFGLSLPTGIATSFILLAFREQLPFSTTFYQVPTGIASIIFTIVLIKNPGLLIIPTTKLTSVTVANRRSGVSAATYPESMEDRSVLNSAAITGISHLIQEIAGKEHLPSALGYADYQIGIFPSPNMFLYSVSNGSHPLLTGLLGLLTSRWAERLGKTPGSVSNTEKQEFWSDIKKYLNLFLE